MAVAIQLYNKSGAKAYAAPYWPIGSIYLSMVNTNPSTWFGGKWNLIAQGRTLVGVNSSDGDFNTSGKAGGEKKHALSLAEMPKHKHDISTWRNMDNTTWGIGATNNRAFSNVASDGDGTSQTATDFKGIGWTGASAAHNNMPPYLTCYIWQRTA